MTYEEAGGIATLFTSILVLFTLWEMKVQRESIYRPDVILKSSGKFFMYKELNGQVYLPSLWFKKGIDFDPIFWGDTIMVDEGKISIMEFDHLQEEGKIEEIGIPLFNIGMGTAKNLTIKWQCNNKYTIDELLEMNKNKEIWPLEKELIWCKQTNNLKMESNIDYLLPIDTESSHKTLKINIPLNIQRYFNLFLTLSLDLSKPLKKLKLATLPEILIVISYYDLVNEKHEKKFNIKFEGKSWILKENLRGQKICFEEIEMEYLVKEVT